MPKSQYAVMSDVDGVSNDAYANHEGVFELKKAEHENIKASIF